MQYLLFTLAAPLASFGTIAVGERRPTWDRPSKSLAIGLVAGALGIERGDAQAQQELTQALGFAVRIDAPGRPLADYHTTQTAPQAAINRRRKAGLPLRTRADELACDDLKTILSRREYRVGSVHTLCLWRRIEGDPTLALMADALLRPAFPPFAGRKANALALPMRPKVFDQPTVEAAFTAYDQSAAFEVREIVSELLQGAPHARPIFADVDVASSVAFTRREQRRDLPESRAKWRFGLRAEVMLAEPSNGKTDP